MSSTGLPCMRDSARMLKLALMPLDGVVVGPRGKIVVKILVLILRKSVHPLHCLRCKQTNPKREKETRGFAAVLCGFPPSSVMPRLLVSQLDG